MERLREAIAKARGERHGRTAPPPPVRPDAWTMLPSAELDEAHLAAERIIGRGTTGPARAAFDVLRTRLMRLLSEKGWRRVLITSPSKGCGKTTVAANLALSLARQEGARTLLVDLDLRTPALARRLGLDSGPLTDWLETDQPPAAHVLRIGETLAVCPNTRPVADPAELLSAPRTARRLGETIETLEPDAVIYDLPPMLVSDDVLGFLPHVDCVLLVAAAGQTTPEEIEACERLLEGQTNFLGVLLNKCTEPPGRAYRDYDHGVAPESGPSRSAAFA